MLLQIPAVLAPSHGLGLHLLHRPETLPVLRADYTEGPRMTPTARAILDAYLLGLRNGVMTWTDARRIAAEIERTE